MGFSKFFYGAGITLLAVFFLASSVAGVLAMPEAGESEASLRDAQYQSMRKAYDNNEWRKVIVQFNSYKDNFVVPERMVVPNVILHMSRDDMSTRKRQVRKHNALRERALRERAEAYAYAALAYAHEGDIPQAEALLQEVESHSEKVAQIDAARGVIAFYQRQADVAEEFFQKAYGIDPENFDAVVYQFRLADKKNEAGTAYFWLEKAIALKPERLDLQMAQARLLQRFGQPAAAEEIYNALITRDPFNAMVLNNRAYCRIALGNLDAAFADLSAALQINAEYSDALMNRAALWRITGNFPAALEDLNRAVNVAPTDTRLLVSRMQTLRDMKHFMLAKQDMETILTQSRSIQSINEAGWFLATCPEQAVRDGKRAVKLLLTIVEQSKRHPRVLDSLAAAYAESGDFDKAVIIQQEAITRGAELRLPNYQLTRFDERMALYVDRRPFRFSVD